MRQQHSTSIATLAGARFQSLASETWAAESTGRPDLGAPPMTRLWSWVGGSLSTLLAVFVLLLTATPAHAQWEIEESHTTASLRGIHNVGAGVAWASGTNGTVLRTEDGGYLWQTCAIPPGAEKLDFRGIQAFDENTAIVMSSGPGDQSRLYKTTDRCQTWKLLFTNPDAKGFWDGIQMVDRDAGIVFGDPAKAENPNPDPTFRMRVTADSGLTWVPVTDSRANPVPGTGIWPLPGESLFAASNSSLVFAYGRLFMATSGSRVLSKELHGLVDSNFRVAGCGGAIDPYSGSCGLPWNEWTNVQTPVAHKTPSSGIFSLAAGQNSKLIAVGGDYSKPSSAIENAAYTFDGGKTWSLAQTPPHGYRSAVAYDPNTKTWITVGPNGTDISTDDGRNWHPLTPTAQDDKDADKNWNALSLPFVVGPKGRIGKLRTNALPAPASSK